MSECVQQVSNPGLLMRLNHLNLGLSKQEFLHELGVSSSTIAEAEHDSADEQLGTQLRCWNIGAWCDVNAATGWPGLCNEAEPSLFTLRWAAPQAMESVLTRDTIRVSGAVSDAQGKSSWSPATAPRTHSCCRFCVVSDRVLQVSWIPRTSQTKQDT